MHTQIPVGLSTASVYPQQAKAAFQYAADLGYDGVEVMVWSDAVSQDVDALEKLRDDAQVPVLAVHAPCLLITQRVWSPDPEIRLRKAVATAVALDAPTVVLHPPFVWQRKYATNFAALVASLEDESGVHIAVENMFPLRAGNRSISAFSPSVDPTDVGHAHYTLDLSHASAAGTNAHELLARMGGNLQHVHLGDGTGLPRDEHLIPGRGTAPCAEVCQLVAASDFAGQVVLEVNTRKADTVDERTALLAESLEFARKYLARG
jgi:sugar phosphate isomerase/epimerase